ncbi:MAG: hypothetical protein J5496_00510 [Lachnospiraceae bacterium]|nr:hypothetical protein [Lachnospiraceae bacterium]
MGIGEIRIPCNASEYRTGQADARDHRAGELQQAEIAGLKTACMPGGKDKGDRRSLANVSNDLIAPKKNKLGFLQTLDRGAYTL